MNLFRSCSFVAVTAGIVTKSTATFTSCRRFSFLARSCYFPKKTRESFENAKKFRPDIIVLDLEDSVEPHQKPELRKLYLQALEDGVFADASVFIRSSRLDDGDELMKDIRAFTGTKMSGFMLPKVESAECILETEYLISKAEGREGLKDGIVKLIPILETPAANFCLSKIASSTKRIAGLIVGSGDFTATVLCEDHSSTYDTFFSNVVLAAKSNNIVALCGVHDKIDDHTGFEKFCLKMKRSGFNGVAGLTPKQVLLANYIFSLSPRERQWTDGVLGNMKYSADSDKTMSSGGHLKTIQRSVQESRQMIGPPHKIKAENMVKGIPHVQSKPLSNPIKGKAPTNELDISLGEVISTPFEAAVNESWKTLWECSFISPHRSVQQSLPFSLVATMAVAFSVSSLSYHARVHLGFRNIFLERPLLVGDTARALFRIDSKESKNGSDRNNYCILKSTHWLVNQRNEIVLQLEKMTMFEANHFKSQIAKGAHHQPTKSLDPHKSFLRNEILKRHDCKKYFPLTAGNKVLNVGDLFVHEFVKVIHHSEMQMLCTLLHIVNPHHHHITRFCSTDILAPGPFVMSAGICIADLELGEAIYEHIPICINPNKTNPGDQLGVLTYIIDCCEVPEIPEFEEVTLKHVVVKNIDMEVISQMDVPLELFKGDVLKPSEYESLCAEYCPILLHKIVCVVVRKIIRVRSGVTSNSQIPKELFHAV